LANVFYDRATGERGVPTHPPTWHRSAEGLRPGVATVLETLAAARPGARTARVNEALGRGADGPTLQLGRAGGGADGRAGPGGGRGGGGAGVPGGPGGGPAGRAARGRRGRASAIARAGRG